MSPDLTPRILDALVANGPAWLLLGLLVLDLRRRLDALTDAISRLTAQIAVVVSRAVGGE